MKIVFFDLETAGITHDAANIQIAAVAVEHGKEVAVFERKIQFDPAKAAPEALVINRYTKENWVDAVTEQQAMQEFSQFCRTHASQTKISKVGKPYTVAMAGGHNIAKFDIDRVVAASKRYSIFMPMGYEFLDTLQAAAWYFLKHPLGKPENLKLGTLCQHFGIDLPNAHEALCDVRGSVELARKLIGGLF